jgi:putative ubiquitin-RnfH superfamily antitoxin RatB of RatAB toxin-antitoxin module
MRVEVVYARPEAQRLLTVEVAPGTRAIEAVEASGILETFPEIDSAAAPLGIFGQRCGHDQILRPGDRVEIYRALRVDPKTARRRRARKQPR